MNQKLQFFEKINTIYPLLGMITFGVILRIIITPFEIPLSLDAIDYFVYSIVMNREGFFPSEYLTVNIGWSSILSIFMYENYNFSMLEMMTIDRIVGIIFSSITIIPIYLLSSIFFNKKTSILCASLFIFEPKIIENSVLGLTEPIFIFFTTFAIYFAMKGGKLFFISFIFAAISAFIRFEGFLLIIPLIISFVLKKSDSKKEIIYFLVGITIFFIIIFLLNEIAYHEEQSNITNSLFSITNFYTNAIENNENQEYTKIYGNTFLDRSYQFLYKGITGFIKFLGWTMIPLLAIFILPGLLFLKKTNLKNLIMIFSFMVFLSCSSFYAYGREISDWRFILPIIPILILVAGKLLQFLDNKYEKSSYFVFTVIILISVVTLIVNYEDSQYDSEIYDATKYLVLYSNGVNSYDGNKFVRTADLDNQWPEIPNTDERKKMTANISKIPTSNLSTIYEIIEEGKKNNLTHLVITEKEKNPNLKKLIYEEPPDYLEKIYDSKDFNAKNIILIFKIKYENLN